ncbi:MAG TPA: LysR family transcriptional regulator, partial [Vicinamibacterales bacterium]|nr:LysR family transcriptional regulator [Vicinamibacterales bacterium]
KNVTRAGVRLNLSQSAMSAALARLRDFFHDELLVLVGRTMVLTPLAEDLSQPVRDVLLQVQATIASKPRFDPAVSARHFTIAVSDFVTNVLMIEFLRGVGKTAPAITFELRRVGQRASEDLEAGTLDFLIAPEPYVSPAHPREKLFEDTHSCIAWTRNRKVGAKLSLQQYLALGHVLVQLDETGPNYDERILRKLNLRRRVEIVATSFEAVPQLIVGTERIATVATRLARKYGKSLPIKVVPVPVDIPPMIEVLQWHRAHDQDPAHAWLRSQLKEAVTTVFGRTHLAVSA